MTNLEWACLLAGFSIGFMAGKFVYEKRRYYPGRSLSCWLRMMFYRWKL